MDDMYNEPALSAPPARAVQPQPTNYETTPMSEDHIQSSTLPEDDAQSSSSIPGGAITFIKRLSASLPAQSQKIIPQKVRTDPSYQMLAIAIIIALLSSSVLAAFLVAGDLGTNAPSHGNQPLAKAHAAAATRSAQGHTTAPQPAPTQAPTQASPSAAQQPTQSPSNSGGNPPPNAGVNPPPNPSGTIPVQFVNLPSQITVNPGRAYYIKVQTQPGLTVILYFTYPDGYREDTGGPADNSGLASIPYSPPIGYSSGQSVVFEATVNDENGNMGQTQATVTVFVTSN